MNHEDKINEMFKLLLKDYHITDENVFKKLRDEILDSINSSIEIMSNQIDIGIKNGYTAEFQLELVKNLLNL